MRSLRDEQAAEDGEPEAGRVVAHRLGDAGRLAVREPRRPVDGVGAGRAEHEPHPRAGEDDVPDLLRRSRGSVTFAAQSQKPTAASAQPSTTGRLAPTAVEHPAADLRGDDEAEEEVQEEEARRRRRLAERDLRVLAGEEEDRDERRASRRRARGSRPGTAGSRRCARRISGDGGPQLERSTNTTSSTSADDDAARSCAGLPQPQIADCWKPKTLSPTPAAISDEPAVVEPRRPVLRRRLRDGDQDQRDDRDRDVDPEDRAPGPLGQVAAGDRADRGQAAGDAEEDRQRLPRSRSGNVCTTIASAAGNMIAPPTPWTTRNVTIHASAQAARRRQPAQRRGAGEDDHAEHDHPPVAGHVGEPAAEGEQAASVSR